jgi:hypothetical protein
MLGRECNCVCITVELYFSVTNVFNRNLKCVGANFKITSGHLFLENVLLPGREEERRRY